MGERGAWFAAREKTAAVSAQPVGKEASRGGVLAALAAEHYVLIVAAQTESDLAAAVRVEVAGKEAVEIGRVVGGQPLFAVRLEVVGT